MRLASFILSTVNYYSELKIYLLSCCCGLYKYGIFFQYRKSTLPYWAFYDFLKFIRVCKLGIHTSFSTSLWLIVSCICIFHLGQNFPVSYLQAQFSHPTCLQAIFPANIHRRIKFLVTFELGHSEMAVKYDSNL